MKFLVLLLVLLFAVWLFRQRSAKRARPPQAPSPQSPTPTPTRMVACLHCGVHLTQSEAVQGSQGAYCCTDHLQRAGDRVVHG